MYIILQADSSTNVHQLLCLKCQACVKLGNTRHSQLIEFLLLKKLLKIILRVKTLPLLIKPAIFRDRRKNHDKKERAERAIWLSKSKYYFCASNNQFHYIQSNFEESWEKLQLLR